MSLKDPRRQSPFKAVAWWTGDKLTSTNFDGSIDIWDLGSGKPSQTIKGHSDIIRSIAWSQDGRLASASDDQTVRLANMELVNNKPCAWLIRNMTLEEWLATQGFLFVYKPACPNLPESHLNIVKWLSDNSLLFGSLASPPLIPIITWQGRAIVLVIVLILLIIIGILWVFFMWTRMLWRSIRK